MLHLWLHCQADVAPVQDAVLARREGEGRGRGGGGEGRGGEEGGREGGRE